MPQYGGLSSRRTPDESRQALAETFRKWGIREWTVTRTGSGVVGEASVAFTLGGERKKMTCAHFREYRRNLHALALTLEDQRLASERGLLGLWQQFFKALPEPREMQPAPADPWAVLGVNRGSGLAVAEAVYRTLARESHPDRGGNPARMAELSRAIEAIRAEKRGPA